jgi:hypothetical protein
VKTEDGGNFPSGAKAQHLLVAFSAQLKSCPDTSSLFKSFFAGYQVELLQNTTFTTAKSDHNKARHFLILGRKNSELIDGYKFL